MNRDMSDEEYIKFLNTINELPIEYHSIIKRGVLQLNDDKKELFSEIDRLNNIINTISTMFNESNFEDGCECKQIKDYLNEVK